MLGVGRSTITRLAARGILPSTARVGGNGMLLFDPAHIEAVANAAAARKRGVTDAARSTPK